MNTIAIPYMYIHVLYVYCKYAHTHNSGTYCSYIMCTYMYMYMLSCTIHVTYMNRLTHTVSRY